jgi:hypothetical protein
LTKLFTLCFIAFTKLIASRPLKKTKDGPLVWHFYTAMAFWDHAITPVDPTNLQRPTNIANPLFASGEDGRYCIISTIALRWIGGRNHPSCRKPGLYSVRWYRTGKLCRLGSRLLAAFPGHVGNCHLTKRVP